MTGPTHLVFGLSLGIAVSRAGLVPLTAPFLLLLCIGALAPDLDGDGTLSRPGTILGRFLPKGLRTMLDGIGQTLSGLANMLTGHRGFFHWLIVPLAMLYGAWIWKSSGFFWFSFGYLTHVMADACTKGGVPLLAPINRNNLSLMPIKTGSRTEACIFVGLIVVVVISGVGLLPEETQRALYYFWNRALEWFR